MLRRGVGMLCLAGNATTFRFNASTQATELRSYPQPFPAATTCAWVIHAPPGQIVVLTVKSADVRYSDVTYSDGPQLIANENGYSTFRSSADHSLTVQVVSPDGVPAQGSLIASYKAAPAPPA